MGALEACFAPFKFGPMVHEIVSRPTPSDPPTQGTGGASFRGAFARFAPQDWLICAYLLILNLALLNGQPGADRAACASRIGALSCMALFSIVLTRILSTTHALQTAISPLLYRLGLYGTIQISYLLFADYLPVVNSRAFDQELFELDLALFGVEPSLWMDQFVTPATTEWFAFFYFSYFLIVAGHVLGAYFLGSSERRVSEFSFGILLVYCVGHTLYMLVPGYGPYIAIADSFNNALPAGPWFDVVKNTVASGGAQKDIFPSLHTAAPTFIALFSFRHRRQQPYRWLWPITAFFSINIVGATLFLRWHYVIDVIAGLMVAAGACYVSVVITERELGRRRRHGLGLIWPAIFPYQRRTDAPLQESGTAQANARTAPLSE